MKGGFGFVSFLPTIKGKRLGFFLRTMPAGDFFVYLMGIRDCGFNVDLDSNGTDSANGPTFKLLGIPYLVGKNKI